MIFNDLGFLFVFLPVVLALFFHVPARFRLTVLLVASAIFYAFEGPVHLAVLLVCVIWVWGITRLKGYNTSRLLPILAVALPLAALVHFKYLGFLATEVLGLPAQKVRDLPLVELVLPAGISFYTFHLVSFAIDRRRGELAKQPSLGRFSLYICFFPHLVAGPILRYHNVEDALAGLRRFRLTGEAATRGICLIVFGLMAKVLLADQLARAMEPLIAGDVGLIGGAYVILSYSFQIYFDFYGYSLVAIGLAILFGFNFPANFNQPYTALNPRDFWHRWHMTLSSWIRDYLYIPFGGNRAWLRNTLAVFFLCGLWHGAGWQFALWGLYHGVLVVGYRLLAPWWDRLPTFVQRTQTFVLVSLGWLLFLFDWHRAKQFVITMSGNPAAAPVPQGASWVLLATAAAVCWFVRFESIADNMVTARSVRAFRAAALAAGFVAVLLFVDDSRTFIYFRF